MKNIVKKSIFILFVILAGILGYTYGRNKFLFSINSGDSEMTQFEHIYQNVMMIEDKLNDEFLGEIDKEKFETGIYKGIMESLDDPYSVYYSEDEFNALQEDTAGEFGGIGIQVSANQNGLIEVIAPMKGTPGEKAGLKPGDFITHINGEQFSADELDNAVKVMRGNPGEEVTISVLRQNESEQEVFDLTIKREIINVETVYYEMLDNNIGYVLLTGFQEKSDEELINAMDDLISKDAKGIVLDLRNNPGGLLDVAMNIAEYLMDKGTVISVRYKDETLNEDLTTTDGKVDIPLTVLINKGSASASEVLSGALQDNERAKIIGETSFGKGVIQQVYPIINEGKKEGLKLTVAEFYTPKGNKIHDVGITPDIEVELPKDIKIIGLENIKEDTQLQRAIKELER